MSLHPMPTNEKPVRDHIRSAALHADSALDHLREAYRLEADDEGDWSQAIYETQEKVRDALNGCMAMLTEMSNK